MTTHSSLRAGAVLALSLLTGCTTLVPVYERAATADGSTAIGAVHAGDRVVVTTQDRVRREFVVAGVSNEAIVGTTSKSSGAAAAPSVRLDEIARIEQRRFSPTKTVLLVLGIGVGAYAIAQAAEGAAATSILGATP